MLTSDESERRVLEDDRLVEAARSGRFDHEESDALAQLLGRLRTCGRGACECVAPGRCTPPD